MATSLASIDEKISSDADFQATLAEMSEEDQTQAIADKKTELIDAELAKEAELAANYKVRAEKAEALAKQLKIKPEEKPEAPKTPELNLKDIRALQDVHDDDVDQITDYAKFKGVSVAEAKKLPEMQSLLRTKEEERKTAQATNTGGGRKGSSKVTGEDLIERAMSGQLPESDEDIVKLAEARLAQKIANIQK